MNKIKIENIDKLLQSEPSEKLLIKAIKDLKFSKKNYKSRIVLTIICIILGLLVGKHPDTVEIMQDILDTVLNIALAMFGIIFTGYALLHGFMNKQLLIQLLSDVKIEKSGEKSRLQDVNENFVYLMLLYTLTVIFTIVIMIIIHCIPKDVVFLSNLRTSNYIAAFMIMIYMEFIGIILWRTVSFISTIFQLFNVYAVAQILEIIEDDSNVEIIEDESSE